MKPSVRTREDALDFVQKVGLCTIFSQKVTGVPAFWDAVDLPTEGGGRTKWGARVEAVWAWKTELPAAYPDEVFYGKIKGGHAALMSMDYLRNQHYPAHHRPVASCRELARRLYELIRVDPAETAELRSEAMARFGCTKSRFESALKELQITLNIARSNDPADERDRWLVWSELYPDFPA